MLDNGGTAASNVSVRAPRSVATRPLTAYAKRLGFGPNTALFSRYLDALHAVTGRSRDALLGEAADFFRSHRTGKQEYARYFVLPEERLLYALWLVRHALENPQSALMFVARGAEPFYQAWQLWRSMLEPRFTLSDAFLLRVCRGYPGDTRLDTEPRHFLSRSILSALSDEERASAVPAGVWEEVEDEAATNGSEKELDAYLRQQWGITSGLRGLAKCPAATLESALTCLADFGIDPLYRRLVWRNRRGRFGTDGITPLIQAGTCTVPGLVDWVRRINVGRLGATFDEEDITNLEAGLAALVDRRGALPARCRELVSGVMRIYLNARLLKRLRGATQHKARPLLNILLRHTAASRALFRPGLDTVASVDEATVSGTSLIGAELSVLSFNASLKHVSLNVAQRTPAASAFLTTEGVLDACATGGLWPQEDMSHFYRGCYDSDMRYTAFDVLARRLDEEHGTTGRTYVAAMLQELERRLQPLIAALRVEVPTYDTGAHVQPRYPIDTILAHVVKLHLRRDHALAFECQRLVMDDDVLQMMSLLQCDFTGWFFLRQFRQRALDWLEAHDGRLPELHDLRELDRRVRFVELAAYFQQMAHRYEADRSELTRAALAIKTQLEDSVTSFLCGRAPFDALRTDFYARFRCA